MRSDRHDSVTNVPANSEKRATTLVRSPPGLASWKSSHPVGSPEALRELHEAAPPLQHATTLPEQAHMSPHSRMSGTTVFPSAALKDSTADNPGLGLFVRRSTDLSGASDDEWPMKGGVSPVSPEETRNPDRWSWSNSNAPPTPRIVASNARNSLQSNQSRSLAAWLRQGHKEEATAEPEPGVGNKPQLKNHAVSPILAPEMPNYKTSQKNGAHGNRTSIFNSNSDKARSGPQLPASKDMMEIARKR